jgi:DNA helicase II / ATP-dependent DNA helicase PcrA
MLAYLKLIVNPQDDVALLRIINAPTRGIGDTTMEKVIAHARRNNITAYQALGQAFAIESIAPATRTRIAKFVAMIEDLKKGIEGKVAPVATRVFEETGLKASLEAGGLEQSVALENVNELLNAASIYDMQTASPTLIDYLQQIALFSDADAFDPTSGRVALMTLHAAKGLEFEHVFIVGLEQNILPHERSNVNPEDLEEERRLFFVGITRAKKGLQISFAQHRLVRGMILRTMPSQFLSEIGQSVPQAPAAPAPTRQQYDEDFPQEHYYDQDTPAVKIPPFVENQPVNHAVFGLGRVKNFVDMGENSVVTVRFNTGQVKTLMVKYAKLTKVT